MVAPYMAESADQIVSDPRLVQRRRWLVWGLMALGLLLATAGWGSTHATRFYFSEAEARGQNTLRLATAVLRGMQRRGFEIHFPRRFTWVMKLVRALPYALSLRLLRRLG